MNDRRDHGRDRDDGHGRSHHHGDHGQGEEPRRGPPDSEFLDLEISKIAYGEASRLTRAAASEIIKEAIVARLKERLGDKLAAIGRIAADELADDLEANLAIEARIAARRDEREATERRVRDVLHASSEATRGKRPAKSPRR
jgi:hypothetical protein